MIKINVVNVKTYERHVVHLLIQTYILSQSEQLPGLNPLH